MIPGEARSRRILRCIQGHIAKSAKDNPDGPIAIYVWLWHSIGQRPGRTLIPRPVRFSYMASHDLISLGRWYFRSRVIRASGRAIARAGVLALAVWLELTKRQ